MKDDFDDFYGSIRQEPDGSLGEGVRNGGGRQERKFELVGLDDLKSSAISEYLVKGWFPRSGLVEVWGPPKCGKSFWVFTVMLHVAMGREYRGHRVHQADIVYLALEGQKGFGRRRDAFYKEFLKPGEKVPAFKLCGAALDLIKDHKKLISDIKDQAADPACVVIDTLNRSINGSESKDADMGAYLRAADAVQRAFDCLVVIIHHCGVDETRPRGHTSQTGAADVQISVKKDDTTNIVTTTVELAKDMAEGATLQSRLKVVELGMDQDGDPITSLAVVPALDSSGAQAKAQAKTTGEQRRFLHILTTATIEAGEFPKDTTKVPTSIKAVTREMLKKYCVSEGWMDEAESGKARAKVSGMINTLAGKRLIGTTDRYVWRVR
jgi:AAA domain